MDFDGLFTEPYQSGFEDTKPSKLSEQLSLDSEFGFTPSALSELPCDLGSLSQFPLVAEPVKKFSAVESRVDRVEPASLFLTNPFDDLGLSLTTEKPSLAATLTAQASFIQESLESSVDDVDSSALKLTKKERFQPYESGKKDTAKKVERAADDYKHTEEYRQRREKNNEAVRKSRAKAKLKSKETEETVHQLRQENIDLKRSLEDLQNQLDTLKTLLTSQAE